MTTDNLVRDMKQHLRIEDPHVGGLAALRFIGLLGRSKYDAYYTGDDSCLGLEILMDSRGRVRCALVDYEQGQITKWGAEIRQMRIDSEYSKRWWQRHNHEVNWWAGKRLELWTGIFGLLPIDFQVKFVGGRSSFVERSQKLKAF